MSSEYEAWIRQSISDLNAARKMHGEFNDKAANFAQQAAEKVIKAYYLFNNEPIQFIHQTKALMEGLLENNLIAVSEFQEKGAVCQVLDKVHRSVSEDEDIVCEMCQVEYPKGVVAPCEDIDYDYAKAKIDSASELIEWLLSKMNNI